MKLLKIRTIQKNIQNIVTALNFNYTLKLKTNHELRFDDITSSQNFKENPKKIVQYNNDIIYPIKDNQLIWSNSASQKNELISEENKLNSLIGSSKLSYLMSLKTKK